MARLVVSVMRVDKCSNLYSQQMYQEMKLWTLQRCCYFCALSKWSDKETSDLLAHRLIQIDSHLFMMILVLIFVRYVFMIIISLTEYIIREKENKNIRGRENIWKVVAHDSNFPAPVYFRLKKILPLVAVIVHEICELSPFEQQSKHTAIITRPWTAFSKTPKIWKIHSLTDL